MLREMVLVLKIEESPFCTKMSVFLPCAEAEITAILKEHKIPKIDPAKEKRLVLNLQLTVSCCLLPA